MASPGMLRSVALVLTRATRRNILDDTMLHRHCRENLKSYKAIRSRDIAVILNVHICYLHVYMWTSICMCVCLQRDGT
jgi:hypothetical protein